MAGKVLSIKLWYDGLGVSGEQWRMSSLVEKIIEFLRKFPQGQQTVNDLVFSTFRSSENNISDPNDFSTIDWERLIDSIDDITDSVSFV